MPLYIGDEGSGGGVGSLGNHASSHAPQTGSDPLTANTTPTTSAVGDSASVGTADTVARGDHRHGREAFAIAGSSAVGDSASAGAASTISRSDHVHGREAFGAVAALGNSGSNGVATTLSRSDHVHKRDVRVSKAGSDVGTRNRINFIEGSNVTLTIADDSANDEVDVTIAASGAADFAPISSNYITVATDATLTGEIGLRNLLPYNEFYWPPPIPVGSALDLNAHNQWWDQEGTPTGGVIYTTATAASVATTYGENLLKCVAAASSDGLKTTWTYANEKRVKSGTYLTALVAVYIVTAARTLTCTLTSSTPTTIATANTSTVGSWVLLALEPGSTTLDGTTVKFSATLDGAGTFYVIPLGALVSTVASPKALPLRPRGQTYVEVSPASIKTLAGIADEATWTDVDITASTSALACRANLRVYALDLATEFWQVYLRRNGSSEAVGTPTLVGYVRSDANDLSVNDVTQVLDDVQIFEYYLDRIAGSAVLQEGEISLIGYWEWE